MRSLKADLICSFIQWSVNRKTHSKSNPLRPPKPTERRVREDGSVAVNDLVYGTEYPNSFFDICYPDADMTKQRPTVVCFHGGGFMFGNKNIGDPLASGRKEKTVLDVLLGEGLNVVNADYCMAPKYRFPAQIRQINGLFSYLNENADDLHLDMQRVIIMGGSAGAMITALFGLIAADPGYAEQFGIDKCGLNYGQIRALIIDEQPLKLDKLDKNAKLLCQAFLGIRDVENSRQAKLLDISAHITDRYPPCVIGSSNLEDWFPRSAEALRDKLAQIGSEYAYFYVPKETEELEHGFLNRFSESRSAAQYLEMILQFIRSHVF